MFPRCESRQHHSRDVEIGESQQDEGHFIQRRTTTRWNWSGRDGYNFTGDAVDHVETIQTRVWTHGVLGVCMQGVLAKVGVTDLWPVRVGHGRMTNQSMLG